VMAQINDIAVKTERSGVTQRPILELVSLCLLNAAQLFNYDQNQIG
jgi:hypothetical protein